MKKRNIGLWLNLLCFLAIAAGCAPPAQPAAIPSATLTPPHAASPVAMETPTVAPSAAVAPKSTPTPIPTLLADEARKRLLDLLANNGNCHLPCLWGITPGRSTSQQAEAILSPLRSISSIYDIPPSFDPAGGFVSPAYVEGDRRLETEAEYSSENEVVSNISFKAWEWKEYIASNGSQGLAGIFDSKTFGQRVDYYSLTQVLSEQGIPDAVMIATMGPPQTEVGSGGFDIALLYPNQGIWVNYTTQMHADGANIYGCPANAHVEMELYHPGDPASFSSLLDKTDWGVKKKGYKPLEGATSMSVEKFYETFRQPTDKCIETPAKLWPTPEPGGG